MRGSKCLSVQPIEDFACFNLWRAKSCSIRRQQVAVGPADSADFEEHRVLLVHLDDKQPLLLQALHDV